MASQRQPRARLFNDSGEIAEAEFAIANITETSCRPAGEEKQENKHDNHQ